MQARQRLWCLHAAAKPLVTQRIGFRQLFDNNDVLPQAAQLYLPLWTPLGADWHPPAPGFFANLASL